MDRRRFLKYAAAGVAMVGSSLAGYEFDRWQSSLAPPTRSMTETQTITQTLSKTVTQTVTKTATEPPQTLNYYLSLLEAKGTDPYVRLAKELRKLPELSNLNEASDELDPAVVKATGGIVETVLRAAQSGLTALGSMLDEGIANKRKFCTPLQAWLWVEIDGKDFNPLENYSLSNLLTVAWLNTSTSNSFNSNKWSYAEAKDRVNSPELVNWFINHYLTFDWSRDQVHPQGPQTTYEVRRGVCRHAAYLGWEFLTRNGYEAKNVTVLKAPGEGHGVTAVRLHDGIWIVVDFGLPGAAWPLRGPFGSYNDVAQYVARELGFQKIAYIFVEDNYEFMQRNNDLE